MFLQILRGFGIIPLESETHVDKYTWVSRGREGSKCGTSAVGLQLTFHSWNGKFVWGDP